MKQVEFNNLIVDDIYLMYDHYTDDAFLVIFKMTDERYAYNELETIGYAYCYHLIYNITKDAPIITIEDAETKMTLISSFRNQLYFKLTDEEIYNHVLIPNI